MKKRLFTVLLAVCLVLALGTVSALAVDTLPAPTDGVITLEDDVTLSATYTVNEEITIDLNGFTISGARLDVGATGDLTIRDTSKAGDGEIVSSSAQTVVVWSGGELTIENGSITNSADEGGIAIYNMGSLTIKNGTISGETVIYNTAYNGGIVEGNIVCNINGGHLVAGIWGVCAFGAGIDQDGNIDYNKVVVNISGGTIECPTNGQAFCTNASSGQRAGYTLNMTGGTVDGGPDGTGMYLPAIGINNISGGVVTGAQGIRICSGELNITGGEIISTAVANNTDLIAGGSGGENGAIVIGKASGGYIGDIEVNVSGNASIRNTATGDGVKPVIVLSDKNMALDSEQKVTLPDGTQSDDLSFNYSEQSISVNIQDVSIEGDVLRISNISPADTEDGGNTTLTIDSATVTGDVINQSKNGGMTVNDSVVNGAVTVSGGNGTIAVLNSSVESKSGIGIILVNTSVGDSEPTTEVGENEAIVDGVGYPTLASAIAAADDGDTVTLVNDVDEQFSLTIQNKDITIVGNGFEANITPSAGATTKAFSLLNSELTLDGVNMTINGTKNSNGNYDGTAFDVRNDGSVLNVVNNSVLNMNNLESAMVFADTSGATVIRGKLNIEDSTVNFTNIDGNASNGGDWKVADSTVTFSNCGSHAMSVETLVANNSDIDITGAGLCGLYGQNIVLNNGTDVTITNSGSQLPKDNWNSTATYKYPVEIKKVDGNCGLIVNSGASITLVDNAKENNVIYMPDGTTLVNDGTINATVVVDENSDMNVLVFFDNGVQCDVQVVNDGKTYTFTAPTRSGYEFRGWRDNSGKLHKAGDVVTVDSDMTFTAVWSAINIPDTYDIEIADAANGEVDTSLSNASAGSTITITATPDSGYSVASVTVTGPDGRVDVVRVNATTYTFKMPAGDVTVRVTFTDSDALPFTDVSAGQWFYDAVAYVYTNGMMEGDSATTFNPDGTMTRAMFWAVLGRIDGATITGTNWADQARDWAMAEGVSDGTDPNGLVTREQMVTMLWRYAGEPESSASLSAYTDAESVSDWAETAMRWAIDEGIITGMTDTTLVPQGTATRAQCAAIFMRFDQM